MSVYSENTTFSLRNRVISLLFYMAATVSPQNWAPEISDFFFAFWINKAGLARRTGICMAVIYTQYTV